MMRKITLLFALVAIMAQVNGQDTFLHWDFEDQTLNPIVGSGTITLVGGVIEPGSGAFPSGSGGGGTFAYSSTDYPEQGTNSGTAGFQFNLSAAGKENINVSFAVRGSNTASKWAIFEYSVDGGTTWATIEDNAGGFTNFWDGEYEVALPAAANNASDLAFRIVTVFEPSTSEYAPINPNNTYGTGGTLRIDDVVFTSGNIVSVNENQLNNFSIYPNPATEGRIVIQTQSAGSLEVTVFDVLGKSVLHQKLANHTLDVSSLKSGIYMVQISSNNGTATKKLIVK